MTEQQIQGIVEAVLTALPQAAAPVTPPIPIEVSARHVHLTQAAVEALFGTGAALTQKRALSQPGEFLSDQRVKIVATKGVLEDVAVLGPVRKAVQVELSLTDARALGVNAPVNLSGNLGGAADVFLVGPAGACEAKNAAIVAQNHIHVPPADALALHVTEGQVVCVRANTARPVIFEHVRVRVSEQFALAMHIDFDEANACALQTGDVGTLLPAAQALPPSVPSGASTPKNMHQKLITEAMAKTMQPPVVLKKGTIVTPAARDIFTQKKIQVEFV
ncbi:MAG: phosphate propanoyltransferase [Oscillospiraceae bacterium]|jgi:propanediol utilization protein|nr:phosphate propanoyltransferase [Oscillospiraceae bacterium]